ncbi:4Fe-4S dicluster domain-containing protein [candidate division WOR-3 bacterium]|nr:4Fe-4S dicluster domain-containing protein [candidate division WOR-3 bacterium]
MRILLGYGRVFASTEREVASNRNSQSGIFVRELTKEYLNSYRIPGFRAFDNFKSFVLPARAKVADYPDEKWIDIKKGKDKTILVGLKACDLASFAILDKVFLDDADFVDPFYKKRRESLILVSSDCTYSSDNCFCNLLGNYPYALKGFDINLSEIDGGYLIESGSSLGNKVLEGLSLPDAKENQISERDKKRKKVLEKLQKTNSEFEKAFSGPDILVSGAFDSDAGWDLGSTCVSCSACTNVCPVCYCFTLFDREGKKKEQYERYMVWDSCQFKGFSQMAGGMNPRFSKMDQFKNRYYHKFFRFFKRYNIYKCTGCGRCIDNCLGDIDMREVLSGAYAYSGKNK